MTIKTAKERAQESGKYADALEVVVFHKQEIAELRAALEAANEKLEIGRMQLAACGIAALSNTPESIRHRLKSNSPYYSESYADVCRTVDREIEYRDRIAELEAKQAPDRSQSTQDQFCDNHCTWRDHHTECVRSQPVDAGIPTSAQPEQEPIAWLIKYEYLSGGTGTWYSGSFLTQDQYSSADLHTYLDQCNRTITPLYTK